MAPVIEFEIDGGWVDVSTQVLHGQKVDVVRRAGWQAQDAAFTSGTFELVLRNVPDPLTGVGPWSIFHPLAAYYGRVGEGTQARVTVSGSQRFAGEISVFALDADPSGRVGWVDVVVLGALGRFEGEDKAIGSPATRAIMASENDATRLAYWPIEEEAEADALISPAGSPPILVVGDVTFGDNTASPSTERMLTFGAGGQLQATVPSYTSTGEIKVCSTWYIGDDQVPDGSLLMRLQLTGGTVGWIDVRYGNPTGSIRVDFYVAGVLDTTVAVAMADRVYGRDFFLSVEFAQDGADIDVTILVVNSTTNGATHSGTVSAETLGRIQRVIVAQTDLDGVGFGQLLIGNDTGAFANYISPTATGGLGTRAFRTESGAGRILRLADEHGLDYDVRSVEVNSNGVGTQSVAGLVECMQEAADADGGMLFEARDALAVAYVDRWSLYNQLPVATVPYAALAEQLRPTRDGLARNTVTVSRVDGATSRYTVPDGDPYHRSTQPAPTGMGTKPGRLNLKTDTDALAEALAGWYAHLGSHRDPGYGALVVELHGPRFTGDTALRDAVLAVDIGDVIRITDLPSWCPPGYVDLLVHAITEVADNTIHTITFSVVPAYPWEVWPVNSAGTTLAVAVDDDDTSLKLAVSSGPGWSTVAEPYHVQSGGEAMTVTTMVVDTATYVGAGAASHGDNATLAPALPASLQVGDAMICVAAIRNTGAAVTTPTGWTVLSSAYNAFRVYGRYYRSGDTAPSVAFTGGSAGDTTSAYVFALRGMSLEDSEARHGATTNSPENQSNSSAQNVAYPAMSVRRDGSVVLYLAWKQDDYTSSTGPGDAEIIEASSTTGSDQSLVGYYDIQTTATDVTAGTITITGGASAISRVILLALRPLLTATVTRGVNDVALSHAVGDTVDAWRPGATAA